MGWKRGSAAAFLIMVSVAVSSAFAAEIVYFKNGTTLPVLSHSIEDDMIQVDLGGSSVMAFPLSMVERIEDGGRNVLVEGDPANRMVQRVGHVQDVTPEPDPVTGEVSPTMRRGKWLGDQSTEQVRDDIETDPTTGLTVFRPLAGTGHPGKEGFKVTGTLAPLAVPPTGSDQQPGKIGTQRLGSGYRIGSSAPAGASRPFLVNYAQRDKPAPAAPPPTESESPGVDSGDDGSQD
jgi:hypothetical protein